MVSEENAFEQAQIFLPKYLTPAQQKQLFEELDSFPDIKNFYLDTENFGQEMLQGDGWTGFVVINFKTLEKKTISGIVLSNTCDISIENKRPLPVRILFAPMIRLSKYIERLRQVGESEQQIESRLNEVRRQHITQIFYLPENTNVLEESMVVLDDVHAHPREDFCNETGSKVFTLSQYAFYIFLMKLSIHFCRFNENIARFQKKEIG
jgi:hypothetical protein